MKFIFFAKIICLISIAVSSCENKNESSAHDEEKERIAKEALKKKQELEEAKRKAEEQITQKKAIFEKLSHLWSIRNNPEYKDAVNTTALEVKEYIETSSDSVFSDKIKSITADHLKCTMLLKHNELNDEELKMFEGFLLDQSDRDLIKKKLNTTLVAIEQTSKAVEGFNASVEEHRRDAQAKGIHESWLKKQSDVEELLIKLEGNLRLDEMSIELAESVGSTDYDLARYYATKRKIISAKHLLRTMKAADHYNKEWAKLSPTVSAIKKLTKAHNVAEMLKCAKIMKASFPKEKMELYIEISQRIIFAKIKSEMESLGEQESKLR